MAMGRGGREVDDLRLAMRSFLILVNNLLLPCRLYD